MTSVFRSSGVLDETDGDDLVMLAEIANAVPAFIYALDDAGRISFVNSELRSFQRLTLEQFKEIDPLTLLHPDDRERCALQFANAFATQRKLTVEFRLRSAITARYHWFLNTTVPRLSGAGEFLGFVGTCIDITERKLVEDQVRFQARALSQVNDAVIAIDNQDLVVYWNNGARKLFGFEIQEVIGRSVRDLNLIAWSRPLDGQGISRGEDVHLTAQGEEIFTESTVSVIRDDRGEKVGLLAVVRDITRSKRAEEAIRTSEEGFRRQFKGTPVPIFTWQRVEDDFILIDFNDAAAVMTEDKIIRLVGKRATKVYKDTPEVVEHLERCFNERSTIRREADFRLLSTGQLKHLDVSFVYVPPDLVLVHTEDITERQVAVNALREAERKYREIFSNATEGIFQTTLDGRIIEANPALARMLGFSSPQEMISERTNIALAYVDPERREELKRQLVGADVVLDFEYETYRRDGEKIWLAENVRAVRDESGAVLYLEGTAEDITERKRAVASLEESEQRFRQIAENIDDVLWMSDSQVSRALYINPAYEKIFGVTRESLYERLRSFVDAVHPDDRQKVADMINEQVQGVYRVYDFRVVHPDGSIRWVQNRSFPIRDAEGNIYRLAGVAEDITERKAAQDTLRQQKELLQAIFDHVPVAISVVDREERIQLVNQTWEKTLGWTLDEVQQPGFDFFSAAYPDPEYRKYVMRFRERTHAQWADFKTRVKDGRVVDTSWAIAHLSDGTRIGIGQDITERKRAQVALQEFSRRVLEAQEAERQRIARELHDEIGQVLTAVRLNLQAVPEDGQIKRGQSYVEENINVVDEALRLVRDLSFELRPSLLDDLGLAAAVRWYVDRYARRSDIKAEVRVDRLETEGRLPWEIETAAFRIVQEALTNVARHAQASRVLIELTPSDGELRLRVKDDGVGFDLIELMDRAVPLATLGLRGMEERANAVGGWLEIDTSSHAGTEIRAQLPLVGRQ